MHVISVTSAAGHVTNPQVREGSPYDMGKRGRISLGSRDPRPVRCMAIGFCSFGARPEGGSRVRFDMVVETPGGSRNKYEMDHGRQKIRLDRLLFTATAYPYDYGFVP